MAWIGKGSVRYVGTLSIVSNLYGPTSSHAEAVRKANSRVMNYNWGESLKNGALVLELRGTLATVKAEFEADLLKAIRDEARGEILADFIVLAFQLYGGFGSAEDSLEKGSRKSGPGSPPDKREITPDITIDLESGNWGFPLSS